jgi:uncharacterized LabA/DUF88 family protein
MPERVMVFVDGSNFLIELSKELNIQFRADRPPPSASRYVQQMIKRIGIRYNIIRSFWFASYQGSDEYRDKIRSYLREYEFEPVLFKKKDGKEKGVDIALTKEMLVNAFNQNFDIGYLIAGDGDYVGLVNEVKRYGPIVRGIFFQHGLSNDLRLAFDSFEYFNDDIWSTLNREGYMQIIQEESRPQ